VTQQQPIRPRTASWRARIRRSIVPLAAVVLVALAACGGDDSDDEGGLSTDETDTSETSGGARTVEVEMADNEFSPSQVEVSAGETVRFVFSNEGEATHDAVIGNEAAQMEHEDEMRAAESGGDGMDGMGHGGAEDEGAVTVEPGATGELVHSFSASDEVLIGCHEPGHYGAGMRLSINVAEA
jgi:uncharacterized cupredoxin-like copper-binding protein